MTAARTWSADHGVIVALLPATLTAGQIITATGAQLARMVKTWPEKKSTKTLDKLPAIPYLRTTGIGGPQQMTTDTRTYSQMIAGEVLAVETLLEGRPKYFDPNDIDEADDEHTRYRDALNELNLPYDYDPASALTDYLNSVALDVTWFSASSSNGGHNKTRVEILRTCGGPRCEIIRDSTDGQQIEINTYDAPEPVDSIRVWAPILAEQLDDLAAITGPQ